MRFPCGDVVTALAAGGEHTCALLGDGGVKCWGRGDRGQLGAGDTADAPTATPVADLGTLYKAKAISAGSES